MGAEEFVCPQSGDTPARGATTQEVAAEIANSPNPEGLTNGSKGKGHVSYIYLGRGMTREPPPSAVILYERLENHEEGINVYFGDGHTEFILKEQAEKMLAELRAGHNPPRLPGLN